MKIFAFALAVGISLAAMNVNAKDNGEVRKLLATHETESTFDGVQYRKCMGRTMRCPKKCGDSGEYATFTIVKYTKYEQHGKYGGKQKSFRIQVSDFDKNAKGDPNILKTVRGLKKGDLVNLCWNHDYVTKNRSSYPERPIVKLEKMEKKPGAAVGKKPAEGCTGTVLELKGNHMPGPGVKPKNGTPMSVPVYIFKGKVKQFKKPDPKHKQLAKIINSDKDGKFQIDLPPGEYTAVAVIKGKMYLNSFQGDGTWTTFTVTKGQYTNVIIKDTSQAFF